MKPNTNSGINKLSELFDKVHPNAFLDEVPTDKAKKRKLNQKLQEVPNAWLRNQRLVINAIMAEIKLLSLKTRVRTITGKLGNDYKELLNKHIWSVYPKQGEILFEQEDNSTDDLDISKISFALNSFIENTNTHLNKSIVNFPDKIEIYEDETLNHFGSQQFNNMPSSHVAVKQLADFLIKNKLEAPLLNLAKQNLQNLTDLTNRINDSKRLISFAKESNDEESKALISSSTAEIKKLLSEIQNTEEAFALELESLYNEMSQQLTYYTFIKTASNLRQYISKQRRVSKTGQIKIKFDNVIQTLRNWQVNLIYAKSQAVVLKKQYEESHRIDNPVKMLLDLNEQLTPSDTMVGKLPFFYKQLFVGQQILHKDFWVGRKEEVDAAQKAIKRYNNGYKGAIAIVGENGVGKSFFTKQLANLEQPKNKIKIRIGNNEENNLETLRQAFNLASENKNRSIEQILNQQEDDSWIILEDIELWWQLGETKQEVIDYIFELIRKYSHKFLFIIVSNRSIFEDISKNQSYLEYFISIIPIRKG